MADQRSASNKVIADTLREFIVAEVGDDLGASMTEQAQRGADQISAALKDQGFGIWMRYVEEGEDW